MSQTQPQEKEVGEAVNEQIDARQRGPDDDGETIRMDHIREDIRKHVSKPMVSQSSPAILFILSISR